MRDVKQSRVLKVREQGFIASSCFVEKMEQKREKEVKIGSRFISVFSTYSLCVSHPCNLCMCVDFHLDTSKRKAGMSKNFQSGDSFGFYFFRDYKIHFFIITSLKMCISC